MSQNLKTEKLKNLRTKKYFFICSFVLSFFSSLVLLFAQSLSSNELINNAKQYDGKSVTYAGEVIGDVMARGQYAWVNLGDKDNAVGIWMKSSDAGQINYRGSYKAQGDILEVTGIFNRSCPDHGGDLDIHAIETRKISSGSKIDERVNLDKVRFGAILAVILILIWISYLLKHGLKKS